MIPFWQTNPNTGAGQVSFDLPLSDAGAGIVNITPLTSLGSPTPTFTRATTAYTLLSTGVWALIASGSPRSIYSPAGIYLGYQAEGARANVLGGTDAIVRTMSDAGWVVGATMTVGTSTGVDGGANACALLTGGAVAATNTILFTTVLASAARTYSVRVRRVSGTSAVNITDNGGTNWTAMTLTATEQLFQVTRTQANPVVGVQVEGNGDSVAVDFNTIEAAGFANPTPIPVNVSKAADLLTYAIAGNIVDATGACYSEITTVAPSATGKVLIGSTTGGQAINILATTNVLSAFDGTADRTLSAGITLPVTTPTKVATTWGGTALTGAVSGTTLAATFDGSMGFTGVLSIGNISGGMAWGSQKNIKIWPTAFSAAVLQALTT